MRFSLLFCVYRFFLISTRRMSPFVCVSFFFSNVLSAYYYRYKLSLSLSFSLFLLVLIIQIIKPNGQMKQKKEKLFIYLFYRWKFSTSFTNLDVYLPQKKRMRMDGKRTNRRRVFRHSFFLSNVTKWMRCITKEMKSTFLTARARDESLVKENRSVIFRPCIIIMDQFFNMFFILVISINGNECRSTKYAKSS
jgi:hypothetical protein